MRRRLEAEKKAREAMPIDHTAEIWENLYQVRVPMLDSRSMEDLRRTGVVVSGIKEIDKDANNRLLTTYITVNQMLEHFKNHVRIYVCNYDDTKKIYQSLSNHIQAWKFQLERGINIGNAPIEDLILMDEFANVVYDKAKYEFKGETIDSLIAQHFSSIQRFNASNIFNADALRRLDGRDKEKNVKIDEHGNTIFNANPDDEIEDRESYSDFFREKCFQMFETKR